MPAARGRGFGEAITWQATRAAPKLPALLLASDAGCPVYERMGYLPLFRFTLWHRTRETEHAAPATDRLSAIVGKLSVVDV